MRVIRNRKTKEAENIFFEVTSELRDIILLDWLNLKEAVNISSKSK